jgi:hypothetical protein
VKRSSLSEPLSFECSNTGCGCHECHRVQGDEALELLPFPKSID